jgi:preprotein translocase subunit SecA
VLPIPTNKPGRRAYLTPRCWRTAEEKWLAIFKQATKVAAQGRAVLVGTRSVDASETLSKLFIERQVPHVVLNARQDANEAGLIAQAGKPGQITIATNMAGRGTDIKLSPEVKEKGGLHVILTEIHESARIDRQLYGRSARQGDPGSVQALISLEDDAFKRYAPVMARWISGLTKSGSQVDTTLLKSLVKLTQSTAEKKNRQIRLDAFKQDQKRREQMGFAGRKQ